MEGDGQRAVQIPPETGGIMTVPSTIGTAVQAHSVTVNNGDFVQAAGNATVNNISNHYHYPAAPKVDIAFVLRLVRNLRQIQQDNFSKATPGTGIWILITKEFILWLDPSGNLKILWGTGIPGAGKTVLASIVINDLEKRAAADRRICVAFIYFRYTDGADLAVRDVFEVLVKQTVERHEDCAAIAEEAYSRHVREGTQPTEAELLQLLHRFTEAKSITFYVLDALDEAPVRIQIDVVRKLASLNVRLFITSRPLKAVEARVPGALGFTIFARESDLDLHISQEIARSRDLQDLLDRADPSMRDEITSRIKKNCRGMFLHASLQLNELCDCASAYKAMEVLKAFPAEIEDVYLRAWDRILKQRHASVAKAVFLWVIYSVRPMTIDELERAVATCPTTFKFEAGQMMSKETLMTICCGLVTIEDGSRLVRLVHYTAKEPLNQLLQKSPPHAHALLAAVSMAHLAQSGFQDTNFYSKAQLDRVLKQDPLLAYAYDAWAMHAQNSLEIAESRLRITSFISKCTAFPFQFNWPVDTLCSLHMLACYNLTFDLLPLGEIGSPNRATGLQKVTPLHLASLRGNEDMVRHLLHLRDIQVNLTDTDRWSALMYAARRGHEGIARLLLARPEILVNLVDRSGRSALMYAARHGHDGVVKLLLGHPAIQVNLISGVWGPALTAAASFGHEGVVKHLLEHPKIQVNIVVVGGLSALSEATGAGHGGVIKLLLGHPDIQVNLTDKSGQSALMKARQKGHASIISALVAHPGFEHVRERLP